MSARLVALSGGAPRAVHEVHAQCVIGRDPTNEVVVASGVVSGRHARIFFDGGSYYLEDLESRNGTRVDGMELSGRRRLGRLHVISLARTHDFVFHQTGATADGEPRAGQSTAPLETSSGESNRTIAMPFDISALPELRSPTRPDDEGSER